MARANSACIGHHLFNAWKIIIGDDEKDNTFFSLQIFKKNFFSWKFRLRHIKTFSALTFDFWNVVLPKINVGLKDRKTLKKAIT